MTMKTGWNQHKNEWWFRDFTALPDSAKLHQRALHGFWQTASYETKAFSGTLILANPFACAPELRIPLPVKGRYSIAVGMCSVSRWGVDFFSRCGLGFPG